MKSLFILLLFFASHAAVTADEASLAVGKTILARGHVTAERKGETVLLERPNPIFQQDVLRSGKKARSQLRMIDNALINLQENSELILREYKFEAGFNGRVVMELTTGGLRTVTGAMNKKNKGHYQLDTPLAKIEAQAAMYEVEIVSEGMYVGAWSGSIQMRSYSGKCHIELGDDVEDRFAFIDVQGACRVLKNVPKIFRSNGSVQNM